MSQSKKVVRTKAFKVIMSKGNPIQIDEEEVDSVVEAMGKGSVIIVKRGIINPSYLVSIEQDQDRIKGWVREWDYGHGVGEKRKAQGLSELTSIFGETKIGQAIEAKRVERLGAPKIKKLK